MVISFKSLRPNSNIRSSTKRKTLGSINDVLVNCLQCEVQKHLLSDVQCTKGFNLCVSHRWFDCYLYLEGNSINLKSAQADQPEHNSSFKRSILFKISIDGSRGLIQCLATDDLRHLSPTKSSQLNMLPIN